jgi:hypothetical protein
MITQCCLILNHSLDCCSKFINFYQNWFWKLVNRR